MTAIKRKGARSLKEIPKAILTQLNAGQIETANLVEWLAIDQNLLLENFLRQQHRLDFLKPALARVDGLKNKTINTVNEAIGTALFLQAEKNNDKEILEIMATHQADLVRCWATYTIGKNETLNIADVLAKIQVFAADTHFGVREIAWLVVRPRIAENIQESIEILTKWTENEDENIRRFASESTRPRGVWCKHLNELKLKPELGLPILEPLKADKAKYVQNSVANWLNDASKDQAEFVIALCSRWEKESHSKETQYIIKKALRTINKVH